MNILFANYGDFTTNSLNHIGGFANVLSSQGHAVVVAVPHGKASLASIANPLFSAATYDEILAKPGYFPGGGTADILHAWTPREWVRKFVGAYQRISPRAARVIVHMEDNEEHLIAGYSRRPLADLRSIGYVELDALLSDSLPHPVRHRLFLRLADAATVIIPRLTELLPPGLPTSVIAPGLDPLYLNAADGASALRAELGLRADEKVIVFTGSNTFANEPEMRELYIAIRLLNDQAVPTRLVRTGFNRPEFLQSLTPDLAEHVLDLGFVEKARLPKLLALADVLVQPGKPGPFNDYRLPSKLPEFLASGRPVVLPRTNIALELTDGQEALFLSSGTPEDIAACCRRIFDDPDLARTLGVRGAAYARRRFDLAANTAALLETYLEVMARPSRAAWDVMRETRTSDLTAAAQEIADALRGAATGGGRAAELAALASDLAEIVRLQDERDCRAAAAADKVRVRLEETVKHLELQRDLTAQHAANLEARVSALERQLVLQKKLSSRHIQNLEVRIREVEQLARTRLKAASDEHAKLANRIRELDTQLTSHDERLRSIIRSRSYKLSAPLRDLEKLCNRFFGKDPFEPPSALRAAPGNSSAPGAPTEPPPAPVEANSGVGEPAEAPAHTYTFNFDHPRSWNTASNKLLILGWCFETSGFPIRGVRARFAGEIIEGVYGSKRLDVLRSTGVRQAEYCGLKIEVRTQLGDHLLIVEAQHFDEWHPFFETMVHVGKAGDPTEMSEYEKWCRQHEALGEADLKAINDHISSFAARPLFSVVMPVYNTPEALLTKAIESVRTQLYPHWELCIADDASTEPHVRATLERLAADDSRIKVAFRTANGHICEASNTALGLATGEFVALFDHDDVLAPIALYEVAAELDSHPGAQFIYSDEDKIDAEDRRFDPYFKPDWNPDLNLGQNYTSHLSVYKTEVLRAVGGFRKGYEGSQDWDLNLRVIERIPASAIRHIPKLLYHWRAVPGSTALQLSEKSYPVQAARMALEDHLVRLGLEAEVIPVPGDHWRIRYPVPSPAPRVTVIIPTRNALKLVRQAVQSILSVTDYPNYEILIVDNQSDDPATISYFSEIARGSDARIRMLPYPEPFNFSAINNRAAREAPGEVLAFLNNDIEAIHADWLSEMVSQAMRPGIGAVGALLYYPFPLNTIQHAGVVLGLGGVAGHPFKELPRGDQGQKNRLRLVQNYSAVTGACMVIRKDRFLEVGGFNEKELSVAFNDVDLCCKLLRAGYRNLWTPFAEFYHHESATRGTDNTPEKRARFQSEIDYMTAAWGDLLLADPAYNPNLTLVGEDFSTAYLSRNTKPWLAHLP